MATFPVSLVDPALYDEEWALSCLLHAGEKVVNIDHLNQLIDRISHLVDKSKYYGEHPECLDMLEEVLMDLKFLKLGTRP